MRRETVNPGEPASEERQEAMNKHLEGQLYQCWGMSAAINHECATEASGRGQLSHAWQISNSMTEQLAAQSEECQRAIIDEDYQHAALMDNLRFIETRTNAMRA